MELIFAYIAGLLTLINPCVLPILPIVLASAVQKGRLGPIYLAIGMSASFVILGLIITVFGHTIGLSEKKLVNFGSIFMIFFGIILLVPSLSAVFSRQLTGLTSSADQALSGVRHKGVLGQVVGGISLGAVWSPCIGPTLGGAISLASQGKNILSASLVMIAFSVGVSTVLIIFAYIAKTALQKNRALFQLLANYARVLMGWSFVCVGVVMFTGAHRILEAWLLRNLPTWLVDLSVMY